MVWHGGSSSGFSGGPEALPAGSRPGRSPKEASLPLPARPLRPPAVLLLLGPASGICARPPGLWGCDSCACGWGAGCWPGLRGNTGSLVLMRLSVFCVLGDRGVLGCLDGSGRPPSEYVRLVLGDTTCGGLCWGAASHLTPARHGGLRDQACLRDLMPTDRAGLACCCTSTHASSQLKCAVTAQRCHAADPCPGSIRLGLTASPASLTRLRLAIMLMCSDSIFAWQS